MSKKSNENIVDIYNLLYKKLEKDNKNVLANPLHYISYYFSKFSKEKKSIDYSSSKNKSDQEKKIINFINENFNLFNNENIKSLKST